MRFAHGLAITFLFITGCDLFDDAQRQEPPDDQAREVGLKRFESEAEFRQYFASQVTSSNDVSFGNDNLGDVRGDGGAADDAVLEEGVTAAPPQQGGAGGEGAPSADSDAASATGEYSTTTQQEEGVQEGDIVKNDGTYLYVLSNSTLRVVQANPGASLQEQSSVALDGYGLELYLAGDTIVAITQPDSFYYPVRLADDALIAPEPGFYRPKINVAVINVANRALPAVQSTSSFEGNLHSSRMIDTTLHLVMVNYPDFFIPFIEFGTGAGVMEDTTPEDILPDFEIKIGEEEPISGEVVAATDFYRPIDPDGYGMTTVLSLDVNNPAGFRSVGVVAYPGNIYASTEALYLTNSNYDFTTGSQETTSVSKFALTEAGPTLVAVGAVPGRVLNQYSMSEYEGHLRVATTVQDFNFEAVTVPPPSNNVYVLGEQAGELVVVGRVENLAPGETIYSARFYGDKGYLVTFEQVDPLFTLDLSDPASPKAVGELKVPGFSTFIVQMDATHLLTVGQDVLLDQGFAIPQGVQLSIFDVSDFANPRLVAAERVAGAEAWSEALYNPKALTFLPSEGLVALPVQIYDYSFIEPVAPPIDVDIDEPNGGGGTPGQSEGGEGESGSDGVAVDETEVDIASSTPTEAFNGIYVYRINAETGFQFAGRLGTVLDASPYYYYSSFTRGVFMGENVFGVTDLGVVGSPKSSIVEATPWRITFPIAAPDPNDVIIDERPPVVVDDGVVIDGDSVVSGGGGSADAGAPAGAN